MGEVKERSVVPRSNKSTSDSKKNLVLVGNPNVGKSTIFNRLSGVYVDVSNYPGTTLDISTSKFQDYTLIDSPGVYGISSFNEEEHITRQVVLKADVVINVVDSITLERDLFLTLHLVDMQIPMIVALNMADRTKEHGIEIAIETLSQRLGVPVVPICGVSSTSVMKLGKEIENARIGKPDSQWRSKVSKLSTEVKGAKFPYAEALLLLEGDKSIQKEQPELAIDAKREEIYVDRRERANMIFRAVVNTSKFKSLSSMIGERIGSWALHPVAGIPILLLSIWLVYQLVGVFVAQQIVGYAETEYGNKMWEPAVKHMFASVTPVVISVSILDENDEVLDVRSFSFPNGTSSDSEKLKSLEMYKEGKNVIESFSFSQRTLWDKLVVVLAGEFGAITMTVTYLLFLIFPLVVTFYFVLSVLEDCGYLPRLAVLVDKSLSFIGLNGKAIIPIILGFGCVTMATITTRLLATSREKTIASSILNFAIPCSAQLAVITILLARAGDKYVLAYSLIILICLIAIGSILNAVLPGKTQPILIDIPEMRLPLMPNVLKKTFVKTFSFMKEATPWFFVGALLISVMQVTGLLDMWISMFESITVGILDLPAEAAKAFVMGIVRRDFGAAGLLDMQLTPSQILISLTVITLFVPCIASVMVLIKERGFSEALAIWSGSWVFAFSVGGILAFIIN